MLAETGKRRREDHCICLQSINSSCFPNMSPAVDPIDILDIRNGGNINPGKAYAMRLWMG